MHSGSRELFVSALPTMDRQRSWLKGLLLLIVCVLKATTVKTTNQVEDEPPDISAMTSLVATLQGGLAFARDSAVHNRAPTKINIDTKYDRSQYAQNSNFHLKDNNQVLSRQRWRVKSNINRNEWIVSPAQENKRRSERSLVEMLKSRRKRSSQSLSDEAAPPQDSANVNQNHADLGNEDTKQSTARGSKVKNLMESSLSSTQVPPSTISQVKITDQSSVNIPDTYSQENESLENHLTTQHTSSNSQKDEITTITEKPSSDQMSDFEPKPIATLPKRPGTFPTQDSKVEVSPESSSSPKPIHGNSEAEITMNPKPSPERTEIKNTLPVKKTNFETLEPDPKTTISTNIETGIRVNGMTPSTLKPDLNIVPTVQRKTTQARSTLPTTLQPKLPSTQASTLELSSPTNSSVKPNDTSQSQVELEERMSGSECSHGSCSSLTIHSSSQRTNDGYWAFGSLMMVLLLLTVGVLYTGLWKKRNHMANPISDVNCHSPAHTRRADFSDILKKKLNYIKTLKTSPISVKMTEIVKSNSRRSGKHNDRYSHRYDRLPLVANHSDQDDTECMEEWEPEDKDHSV